MGSYLNPGTKGFEESLNSEIYVDKTLLLEQTNARINTKQKFLCVSRPRRFGKSMAMDMLSAYYKCGEDTSALFENLKIASAESYNEHLNQYHVIKINMQMFLSGTDSVDEMLKTLQMRVLRDLKRAYPDLIDGDSLIWAMMDVYSETNRPFVILIDEWDCLFREYAHNTNAQRKYLDFLRAWLKDQDYVALAYMTGILPIKKYGTHSALNMFTEYSMTDPRELAEYFGFTEDEVKALCEEYEMDFDEA
ncbi:MAG: AAA family ATPase, partial [Clostridia bacterium]|nr:AAA family ATPase [Clostridia bacterium]